MRRDFYSVLYGISSTAVQLTGKILGWLMDLGRLPMYNLARRLELELAGWCSLPRRPGGLLSLYLQAHSPIVSLISGISFSSDLRGCGFSVSKWLKVRHALGHNGEGIIIIYFPILILVLD
jgi:hypothetical protein